MEFLFNMLKFGVAWFVGNFFATSITMIGCCLFCAFPLLRKLKPYSDYINISRLKGIYRGSVLLHAAILALASWAVITFAPQIIQYGFFFSLAFTVLIGIGKWGQNETNVNEFLQMLNKHIIPGKEDEALRALKKVFGIDQ